MVAAFAMQRGLVSRALRMRPLLFLGLISYSLYMTHMFVQLRLTNLARLSDTVLATEFVTRMGSTARYGEGIDAGNPYLGDLLMLLMLAATVLMSWLTWRFVEMPGRNAMRRLAPRLFGPAQQRRDERKGRSRRPLEVLN
jgi:peptidoglycan/LPS O-acetylase OafA/YrhL